MNEREYLLAQDLTRCRVAEEVLNEILNPSRDLHEVRARLRKLIERGYKSLDKVMEEEA